MRTYSDNNIERRQSFFIPVLIFSIVFVLSITVGSVLSIKYFNKKAISSPTQKALVSKWSVYDYESVYEISRQILEKNPFNTIALTYHGYSSFYLAVSQLDNATAQTYLDDCINSLRLALVDSKKSIIPQIDYILGKAYFYKNTVTSYYYADLAVKYLKEAKSKGYKADDIPEYLGLSYAALGMTEESISAFTEALIIRESDSLLLSIAEQYYKAGLQTPAKQYLFRIKKDCENEELVLKSMNLLGTIYIDEKKYTEAKQEFEEILKKNPNSADAYYGLGVIYEKQGDMVKARSEWRRALRIQVNHSGALTKIAEN